MKLRICIAFICFNFFIFACDNSDNDGDNIISNITFSFSGIVEQPAPDGVVKIINLYGQKYSYNWKYIVGGDTLRSTLFQPEIKNIDKAGDFKIWLSVDEGNSIRDTNFVVQVPGSSAILSFDNIEFSIDENQNSIKAFSAVESKFYTESEIKSNIDKIDLILTYDGSNTRLRFVNSKEYGYSDGSVKNSIIINSPSGTPLSVEEIKNMKNDEVISRLALEHDYGSFKLSDIPNHIVYFETQEKQKGVILLKSFLNNKIYADIKLCKYPIED
ncbi:MAG: hypothetical protein N4A49_10315 [Marinifilaceae bacterium]|jgi:hypothetical protein|nr:hypothetical protein [Marinifilaceae bacterium]